MKFRLTNPEFYITRANTIKGLIRRNAFLFQDRTDGVSRVRHRRAILVQRTQYRAVSPALQATANAITKGCAPRFQPPPNQTFPKP